jgi:hypothetical protein
MYHAGSFLQPAAWAPAGIGRLTKYLMPMRLCDIGISRSQRRKKMKACRECQHQVSEEAVICPGCGIPYPAKDKWDGWGYEYKSKATLLGLPWLHISFKYRPSRAPVPARGVIAIGQFAVGFITISQFGIGIMSISQFTVAAYALAQFAFAYSLIAQIGIYIHEGHGQLVRSLGSLLGML